MIVITQQQQNNTIDRMQMMAAIIEENPDPRDTDPNVTLTPAMYISIFKGQQAKKVLAELFTKLMSEVREGQRNGRAFGSIEFITR